MNTFKKNGGFTLVELIIVIAILAILSTGAVAGYSAYIKSANDAAVNAWLSDLQTAAVLANAETGAISEITVTKKDDTTVTVVVSNVGGKFQGLFEPSFGVSGTYDASAKTFTFDVKEPSSWDNCTFMTTANATGVKWTSAGWTVQTSA